MLDKINEVAAKQRRVDAERDALLGKALAFQAVLNKVFGDARVVGQSSTEILERYGPDDGAYGHLYYEGTELWVAFRTNEDDLEDAHHKDDNPSYRMRSPGEVPRTWLEPLLTKESLESLIADIGGRVDAQAARVARATTGVDSIVAAESAKIDVQLAHSLQAFGSTTL
ncbi:MAG: hypothetical protein IOB09_31790, partial [Burkholderia sp.]|nr:hypothetical protein [Burkholderia sp.]